MIMERLQDLGRAFFSKVVVTSSVLMRAPGVRLVEILLFCAIPIIRWCLLADFLSTVGDGLLVMGVLCAQVALDLNHAVDQVFR